ncbi:uncharacterized protein M6B38_324165 [Iris pallida]|uniref:Ig-like domain-containing protein n=1 Tax=Iris pallida TaxID=29817 RepID=A0AAX6H7J6_IRIPA|nr:uncharacterized protein M6B38_324165 [Iris pallida]
MPDAATKPRRRLRCDCLLHRGRGIMVETPPTSSGQLWPLDCSSAVVLSAQRDQRHRSSQDLPRVPLTDSLSHDELAFSCQVPSGVPSSRRRLLQFPPESSEWRKALVTLVLSLLYPFLIMS